MIPIIEQYLHYSTYLHLFTLPNDYDASAICLLGLKDSDDSSQALLIHLLSRQATKEQGEQKESNQDSRTHLNKKYKHQ